MHWNIFKIEFIGFIFKSIFIFWEQDDFPKVDVLLMSLNANFVQKTSIVKKNQQQQHTHTHKIMQTCFLIGMPPSCDEGPKARLNNQSE